MAHLRLVFGVAFVAMLLGFVPRPSQAQRLSYGADRARTVQSLALAYTWIDFAYNGGDEEPPISFNFAGPAYGLAFTRPNFLASLAVDEVGSGRRVLDAALFTWGELYPLPRLAEGRFRLYVPIALHSGYRRVVDRSSDNEFDTSFSVTVLGLGAGAGASGRLGEHVIVEGRATPVIGLATREFDGSIGSTRLFDADVQAHLGPLVGRFGLSLGYGFRVQVWNLRASDLFAEVVDDLYDYRGARHTVRIGVNF